RQLPADQQRALLHARETKPAVARARVARLAGQAAPIVGHPQHGPADERELDSHPFRAGVLGDVRQALLRDPVEDELLLVAELRQLAAAKEAGIDPRSLAEF